MKTRQQERKNGTIFIPLSLTHNQNEYKQASIRKNVEKKKRQKINHGHG